jgi:hypothetical protein
LVAQLILFEGGSEAKRSYGEPRCLLRQSSHP